MAIIFLTSGTTWLVPGDFTSVNTIEAIGPGGNGGGGAGSSTGWCGGGGGAYTKLSSVVLTPGVSIAIIVPVGGSELATTVKNDQGVTILSAAPGMNGTQFVNGNGGDAGFSIPSAAAFFGGDGGISDVGTGGGGGGGSAGPSGGGSSGGSPSNPPSNPVGGGGGGSNGTSSTNGGDGTALAGGSGGLGTSGLGGGAGATSTTAATIGTLGGGGGGGFSVGHATGAAGGLDASWDASHGAGGGGGGGGQDATAANVTGGNGAVYGGGGAGAGSISGSGTVTGGIGGHGLIVITYTPKKNLSDKIVDGIFAFAPLASLLALRTDGNPAVYRNQLQQGSAFPAIVFQLISGGQNYSNYQRLSTSFNRVQFTIWAYDPDQAEAIEQQLYTFLDQFNPAGLDPNLRGYPNSVVLNRDGMYTQTQPPQYWRINDAQIFDNSNVA